MDIQVPFNFNSYLSLMFLDKQRHIRVIAKYMQVRNLHYSSKEQIAIVIRRHMRAAKQVGEFENTKILNAMDVCQKMESKNPDIRWTLESVLKELTK